MKTTAKTLIAAAILSASMFSGAAFARTGDVFTARLAAPVSEATRVITGNALWNCEGDTCVARGVDGVSVRDCRQFVRESGAQVAAFGAGDRALTADQLARCNAILDTSQALQAAN